MADHNKAAELIADLTEALEDMREFLSGQVDVVDGDYGEPRPNRAMILTTRIDELLAKADTYAVDAARS